MTAALLRPSLILALATLCTLVACGPVRRVNPPGASIQKLTVQADGTLVLDLRLQNFSDIATRFARFDGALTLAGIEAGPLAVALDVEVPAHAADVVRANFAPAAIAKEPLAAAFAGTRKTGVGYRLVGRIEISEPRGGYDVEYESVLSPVPGVPGEYR